MKGPNCPSLARCARSTDNQPSPASKLSRDLATARRAPERAQTCALDAPPLPRLPVLHGTPRVSCFGVRARRSLGAAGSTAHDARGNTEYCAKACVCHGVATAGRLSRSACRCRSKTGRRAQERLKQPGTGFQVRGRTQRQPQRAPCAAWLSPKCTCPPCTSGPPQRLAPVGKRSISAWPKLRWEQVVVCLCVCRASGRGTRHFHPTWCGRVSRQPVRTSSFPPNMAWQITWKVLRWQAAGRTYIQPSTVWQFMQDMSATQCRPVISRRSSLGPRVTLTLRDPHPAVLAGLHNHGGPELPRGAGRPLLCITKSRRSQSNAKNGWETSLACSLCAGPDCSIAEQAWHVRTTVSKRYMQVSLRRSHAGSVTGMCQAGKSGGTHTFLKRKARPCRPWKACGILPSLELKLPTRSYSSNTLEQKVKSQTASPNTGFSEL